MGGTHASKERPGEKGGGWKGAAAGKMLKSEGKIQCGRPATHRQTNAYKDDQVTVNQMSGQARVGEIIQANERMGPPQGWS